MNAEIEKQRTPIYPHQRREVHHLLKTASDCLVEIVEGRYNLDPLTRDAVNMARGSLNLADLYLSSQPDIPKNWGAA